MCFKCSVIQPDLFSNISAVSDVGRLAAPLAFDAMPASADRATRGCQSEAELDLPAVLKRLAGSSARPRYTFMVLNLIARAAGSSNSAGPYVREAGEAVPVRDWLTDALLPMAQRDARRQSIVAQVRAGLTARKALPVDPTAAELMVADEVRTRLRHSGRTNVSRAVSDLVRAGLLRRHYQGYCVDHENRGAQREAVYTIVPAVKRALGNGA